jgi:hypothetical protein
LPLIPPATTTLVHNLLATITLLLPLILALATFSRMAYPRTPMQATTQHLPTRLGTAQQGLIVRLRMQLGAPDRLVLLPTPTPDRLDGTTRLTRSRVALHPTRMATPLRTSSLALHPARMVLVTRLLLPTTKTGIHPGDLVLLLGSLTAWASPGDLGGGRGRVTSGSE